jgi:hypothetical protein
MLHTHAEAYDELLTGREPIPLAAIHFTREEHRFPDGTIIYGRPRAELPGVLMGIDGAWFACGVTIRRAIWLHDTKRPIVGGMSGTPIMVRDGAIGICCVSGGIGTKGHHEGGPNPSLVHSLPGWMLAPDDGT